MKRQGHYCKVCDEYKAHEKFSGKGHAVHICKACAQLPPEEQAERMTLNRGSFPARKKAGCGTGCRISARRCGSWHGSSMKRVLALEVASDE